MTIKDKPFTRIEKVLPLIVALLLRLLSLTWRIRLEGKEQIESLLDQGSSFICSTWHQNIIFMIWYVRKMNPLSLTSKSRDGQLISEVCRKFNHETISGSSSRGGSQAMFQAIKTLKKRKKNLFITPDGPLGPPLRCKSGVVFLAGKLQIPIVPLHYEADRFWVAEKSWDKHKLPKPFAQIRVSFGEAISVTRQKDEEYLELKRQETEKKMFALCKPL